MSYFRKVYIHGDVIERVEYQNGRVGQKDGSRVREEGTTPERALKWKTMELEKKIWRLLDLNFGSGDMWCTLTFRKECRLEDNEEVQTVVQKFLRSLRTLYKRNGKILKYIMSCGRGSRGGVHFHLVLSDFPEWSKVADLWNKYANGGEYGRVNFTPLHRKKNYRKLAAYIVKNGQEDFRKICSIFGKRVTYSRNLISHEVKPQKISARTWRKNPPMLKGYFIDLELSYEGTDINGYPYRYTVYIKLDGYKQEEARCQLSNRRI